MRVSDNTAVSLVRNNIGKNRSKMEQTQIQASSLKRINTPSDDPAGAAKLMLIRKEQLEDRQFVDNINLAKSFLNYTDSALDDLSEILVRAKEIAVQQSSSAGANEDSRLAIAGEVKTLIERTLSIANRKIGNRYIFGGYLVEKPPFSDKFDYRGDQGKINIEIMKDVFIDINLPGEEIFTKGRSNPLRAADRLLASPNKDSDSAYIDPNNTEENVGTNIFKVLESLRISLMANDTKSIQDTLPGLDSALTQTISNRASVGSRLSNMDSAVSHLAKAEEMNAQLASEISDADVMKVVSDLQREQFVLNASLSSSQKMLQPSLLDWFK